MVFCIQISNRSSPQAGVFERIFWIWVELLNLFYKPVFASAAEKSSVSFPAGLENPGKNFANVSSILQRLAISNGSSASGKSAELMPAFQPVLKYC